MDSPDLATPMTDPATPSAGHTAAAVPPPRLLTGPLAMVFLSSFGAGTSFSLLLSAVPLYASSIGAGGMGAGLTTGVLMASTVVAELCAPRLASRFGYRAAMAAGLALLGVPALMLPGSASTATVMAVCVLRGAGFAITAVLGGALVATLVPPERRGEGLGLHGVVVGVPAVIALPLGIWLAERIGYTPVFTAGALAALAGLAAVPALPARTPRPGSRTRVRQPLGVLAGLRVPALVRPSIVFSAAATAAGIVATFLPVALPPGSGGLAAASLFAQAATSTLARWWAGRHADRNGAGRLLAPGVLLTAAGMAVPALTTSPVAVVAGMALFGVGFGIAQNASLTLMFERVPASAYGTASAVWNLAYDAGMGLGAAAFGVLAARTGYPAAFALTAALIPVALVFARPAKAT
ncbi:MFS transporter [Streptosporangium sp. NPDC000396]|uniref:MFS transporter n=1 Tax=Streptosporangium sp. NPDC000396 TaxID=3366185 RepID=UPI003687A7BC